MLFVPLISICWATIVPLLPQSLSASGKGNNKNNTNFANSQLRLLPSLFLSFCQSTPQDVGAILVTADSQVNCPTFLSWTIKSAANIYCAGKRSTLASWRPHGLVDRIAANPNSLRTRERTPLLRPTVRQEGEYRPDLLQEDTSVLPKSPRRPRRMDMPAMVRQSQPRTEPRMDMPVMVRQSHSRTVT